MNDRELALAKAAAEKITAAMLADLPDPPQARKYERYPRPLTTRQRYHYLKSNHLCTRCRAALPVDSKLAMCADCRAWRKLRYAGAESPRQPRATPAPNCADCHGTGTYLSQLGHSHRFRAITCPTCKNNPPAK